MKRFSSICLSLLLILSLCSPAYAAESETHTPLEKPTKSPAQVEDDVSKWESAFDSDFSGTCEKIMRDYSNRKGVIMEESTWESFWSSYFNVAQDSLDTARSWIGVDGDVVVPSSVGQQFYNSLTLYIENQYGYKIYPANKYTPSQYASLMRYFSNGQQANISNTLAADYAFNFYIPSNNSSDGCLYYPSGDTPYIVLNSSPAGSRPGYYAFEFYNSDLSEHMMNMATRQQIYTYRQSRILTNYPWQLGDISFPSSSPGLVYYVYFKTDTKVFSSQAALRSYILDGQSIYIMSGLSGRVDDLNVSVNTLSVDYQKYTEEAIAKLTQAIQDSKTELNVDTLTEEQLQQVIDRSLGSSLDDLNKTLEDMANQNALDNAEMIQILKLIYNKLDQWDKKLFNDVTTGINLQDLKDLLQVDEDLTDAPKTIMEQLNLSINSIPDKILNGLDAHLDAALDKFFENKLEPLLRELIVPDQDHVQTSIANVKSKLPFVDAILSFSSHLQSKFNEPFEFDGNFSFGSIDSPSFQTAEFDEEDSSDDPILNYTPRGSLISVIGPLNFDFSWYLFYRPFIHDIIRGFLWAGFFLRLMWLLPKIIAGDANFWKDF